MDCCPSTDRVKDFLKTLIQNARGPAPINDVVQLMSSALGVPAAGDRVLHAEGNPDAIVWMGLSNIVADAIIQARKERLIFFVPVTAEQYQKDGIDFGRNGLDVTDWNNPNPNITRPTWTPFAIFSRPTSKRQLPPWLDEEELTIMNRSCDSQ